MCLELCFEKFSFLTSFPVYIDGNNVAYSRQNKSEKPSLSDILLLIKYLREKLGFPIDKIYCICDPTLKYYIDKPTEYEALIKEGLIIEAPKVADEFILSFALKLDFCFIISNDRFREYLDQLPSRQWLKDRTISFIIICEKICLSPNISYERINEMAINERIHKNKYKKTNTQEKENQISTLAILKEIENTKGELDLF